MGTAFCNDLGGYVLMSFSTHERRFKHWWLDRCFLYVGRMVEAKGVPYILRAWLSLANELGPGCPPLWLVGGEPSEIESMRCTVDLKALEPHEASGQVKWWGYLDAAGISTVMLKAYVLVTHSLYEPGGRVLLEAMAQANPVIATPRGFAADLIEDWRAGFLVNYGDSDSLRRRMGHFALQPLLRCAMGRVAQRIAFEALARWNFMETHLRVYSFATLRNSDGLSELARPLVSGAVNRPVPRSFDGVYPFEGETADTAEAIAFLTKHGGRGDEEIRELVSASGRSRLWEARGHGCAWVIKHAPSTYRRRPMWDRGFGGGAAETQRLRVYGEASASLCSGAAPVAAADAQAGLILREWLNPTVVDMSTLSACATALKTFHTAKHPAINIESIREQVDQDWRSKSEDSVIHDLTAFEANWRVENCTWDAWKPMSLRLGWRWLELGLRRRWLSLPAGVDDEVRSAAFEESAFAAAAERDASFGFCHGDCSAAHFRMDRSGAVVLIDCERFHPGYFGHDWAVLVLQLLTSTTEDGTTFDIMRRAFEPIETAFCSPSVLVSWLKWIAAMSMCRAHALIDEDAMTVGLLRWKQLQRFD